MMRRIVLAVGAALVVAPAGLATAQASATTDAGAHVAAANWPVVRPGAKGERVRTIQLLLNQHGAHVTVDAVFGGATTTAVKDFQSKNHLVVDGSVVAATWAKLVVKLKRGDHGDAVRALQHQLHFQYGYKAVTVDAIFGAATETAVKNLQGKHRLAVDGIVGTATWQAIEA